MSYAIISKAALVVLFGGNRGFSPGNSIDSSGL